MNYFLDTTDTIIDGVGFNHYSLLHIIWLVIFVIFVVYLSLYYKKIDEVKRSKLRKIIAWAIIFNEVWKMFWLTIGGRYTFDYLPLHLCSVNIMVIAWHAYRPSKLIDNFLYLVCIPGAIVALLFPSWNALPLANFMHLHSFTIHILLAAYPIMLLVGKDIRPEPKYIPHCMMTLSIMAIIIYGVNILLDTNFMFLMYAKQNNPLYVFEQMFGSHLVGFPIIIFPLVLIMYAPYLLKKRG